MYDVDFFIKKFEAIPEENFIRFNYHNRAKTKFCVLGHCGCTRKIGDTEESEALNNLFWIHKMTSPAAVNDGDCGEYPQPTPKQRILAALYDIKAKGESKRQDSELIEV